MPEAGAREPPWASWAVAIALAALVAAVYGAVGGLGFVNFDDPRYVSQNPEVAQGLTAGGARWAFTAFHAGNWHPLTWLSHMLDVELFGLDPGRHHAVNALLHGVATLLVFGFLRAATRRTWAGALAAALFAVHPQHVESVAWISERKDLLCTVFYLASCWAWVRWARQPSPARLATVFATFVLALLSKPMAVSLPIALLVLDFWPLGRLEGPGTAPAARLLALLREKLPLLTMSLASSVVTLLAQSRGGAVADQQTLGLGARLGNAVLACAIYLRRTAWPADLAVVYPHPALSPGGLRAGEVGAAALVLAALSALTLWQRVRRPYLLSGWLWFLVALAPVIGLVQVGLQGSADRYTYLPHVGLFAALAWLLADLAAHSRARRAAAVGASLAILAALGLQARLQVETWRDSFTLFDRALAVVPDNWLALRNLGVAYQDARRPAEAIAALERSVRLMPADGQTWMNLGIAYASAGRVDDAGTAFGRAVQMRPGDDHVWFNLGIFYLLSGQPERVPAVEQRLRALNPGLADRLAQRAIRAAPPR